MASATLDTLFLEFPFPVLSGKPDSTRITGVTADSRQIQPGNLFVACRGERFDGHKFIFQAIEKGAGAIVGSDLITDLKIPYIQLENSRQSLAYLAAAFCEFPARKLTVIGVTGTDGKTTTCNIFHHILMQAGIKTGLISTVNAVIGDQVLDTGLHVTTPDAPDVQNYLAQMVAAGLTHVVLETTSHGWAQYRVDSCEFDIGIVTNITHEHLDEHGSYENYRAAKARLFLGLSETKLTPHGNIRLGVLNCDDRSYQYLLETLDTEYVSYGLNDCSDVRAVDIQYDPTGISFLAKGNGWQIPVKSELVGTFNVSNLLAVISAAVEGLRLPPHDVAEAILNFEGIPGRMERIDLGQNFSAIVDFAHTPNALENAISTARQITDKRVISVFGSAGLRDLEKRRMMAEISADLADISIFTAEDPRTESLDAILYDMATGAQSRGGVERRTFWQIPDRGEAIRFAISIAKPGDVVIACGKGHEQSMCFGTTEYPWDDRTATAAALDAYLNGSPMVDLGLPTFNDT